MTDIIPGMVLGLREGLEAFLVIGIMMKYLEKSGKPSLKTPVKIGMGIGLGGSIVLGLLLWGAISLLQGSSDNIGKLWESVASIAGLVLLSSFIFWMMKHGKSVTVEVKSQVDKRITKWGVMSLAAVVVLREGVEIALFAFSSVDERIYVIGVLVGVAASAILAYLIFLSLVKINLSLLFTITLAYLVLQAGYLLGYSVHEFLSAMKGLGKIAPDHVIYIKAFTLQDTVFDHKTGALGITFNILVGWYSRPEWLQFGLHYGYVIFMFLLWKMVRSSQKRAISTPIG